MLGGTTAGCLHHVDRWFSDPSRDVIPRADMNLRNAANSLSIACLLAVALKPLKAHGGTPPTELLIPEL
jgi:hypothetical protein